MELRRNTILRRRKTNNYPKYKDGADYGAIVTSGINFTGSSIAALSGPKSVEEILAESTNEVGSGTGFTYNKIGYVNKGLLMSELGGQNINNTLGTIGSGAALGGSIGMIGGPIGAGIGAAAGAVAGAAIGIIGGANRKSKMLARIRKANENIYNLNLYNLASAQSDYLQNLYSLDYGNTQGGLLYAANKGRDLIRPKM